MKKHPVLMTLLVTLSLFIGICASAAPVPPVGPADIEGTITDVTWLPEQFFRGIPGMSGTAGMDRKIPPRFRVSLTDYKGIDEKQVYRMKNYFSWAVSEKFTAQGYPEYIVLELQHPDKSLLKKGMRIKVTGYRLGGDEGGDWTTYKEIEILRTGDVK